MQSVSQNTGSTERSTFTKQKLDSLTLPITGRRYVYDAKTPGLTVCVSATGGRVFYLYRKIDGRPERIKIGPYPRTTIEQAREAAAKMNGRIAEGQNPNDKRRINRNAPTLGQVYDEYIEQPIRGKKKRPRSPKTLKEYKALWTNHLEPWRNRQLSQIRRHTIDQLHNEIGKTAPYVANRVLSLIKSLLNYAVEEEYFPANVAALLRPFEESSRERYLEADELPKFWLAVEKEAAADYYKILLLTGARSGNVRSARWEDINLAAGEWNIPLTKSGKPLCVPLSPPALEILRRRQTTATTEWVFPSQDGTRAMPSPRHGWERVVAAAGITDLRVHDLRRSLASWQVMTGGSLTVIGKSLGHDSLEATKIYAHADKVAVRASMDAAAAAILSAAKPKKMRKGKVAK